VIVIAWVEAKPGAVGTLFFANRGSLPIAAIYKVMGKMFAIVGLRGGENVILKCDPELVPALKDRYTGVGHRSHLDRRFWISVSLDADVPVGQIRRLISQSYELVCANLTRKQQAQLAEPSRALGVCR
jgi:predicted DNA-binding protein (MmcQ/YjbR family)